MTGPSLIEIRPDVMLGKPCLAGTRIPVSSEESRTTDSLRPGRVGEFLARWCRAEAACAL